MKSRYRQRCGLTMVEVLVVIAIIGILAGLLLPAVQRVRESGRRASCANNLSQIGKALSGYQARDGRFPAAGRGYSWCSMTNNNGSPNGSVGDSKIYNSNGLVELLPFIDQLPVYDRFDHSKAFNSCGGPLANGGNSWLNTMSATTEGDPTANAAVAQTVLSAFRCPSDGQQPKPWGGGVYGSGSNTNYDFIGIASSPIAAAGSSPGSARYNEGGFCNLWRAAGVNKRMFGQNSMTTPAHVVDGLSNTLAIGETTVFHVSGLGFAWGYRCWAMQGIDVSVINDWTANLPAGTAPIVGRVGINTRSAASLHPGGCHFLLGDGVVRFFSETSDQTAMHSLARIQDSLTIWPE